MYIHNSFCHRELPFYKHLDKVLVSSHMAPGNVRKLCDSFEVVGSHGTHTALVLQVPQMRFRDMDAVFTEGKGAA